MTIETVPGAVPLAEARVYLRSAAGADDALIARTIAAASAACEAYTGVALVTRERVAVLTITGAWQRLPGAPVRAITLVEGLPAEGSAFAFPVGAYAVDIDGSAASGGDGWVRVTQPGAAGRMRVTYHVGFAGAAEQVPDALRQGIMMLAARLLRERDADAGRDGSAVAVPGSVEALWRAWRRLRLG
jgi:uncharacterized phiE125 gp8 family phage protein